MATEVVAAGPSGAEQAGPDAAPTAPRVLPYRWPTPLALCARGDRLPLQGDG
jgi:hypothetical protein